MKLKKPRRTKSMAKRRKKRRTRAKRRTYRRRAPVIVVSNPKKRRRHSYKRRTAKRRRVRRNPGISLKKIKIGDILLNGLIAGGGAMASVVATNFIGTFVAGITKKEVTAQMKNWMLLGVAAILGVVVPKTKLLKGKNAEVFGIGALAVAAVNIAKNSFGLNKFLTVAGTEEEELDKIIANLNVSGISENTLLGTDIPLMGIAENISGEDIPLMGIAESLQGISDDFDRLEEYE